MRAGALAIIAFLTACTSTKDNSVDEDLAGSERHTNYEAEASWIRNKTLKNAQSTVKLGGKDVTINVNDLSLATSGSFDVDSLYVTYNGETHIHMALDLTNLKSLQQDEAGKVSIADPQYLNIERYPYAFIDIRYPADPGAPYTMKATFKGKTFEPDNKNTLANWKNEKLMRFESDIIIDGIEHELMDPDVIQTIESDEIVISVKLNQTENG